MWGCGTRCGAGGWLGPTERAHVEMGVPIATPQPPQSPAQSGGHRHTWAPMESLCLNHRGLTDPSQTPWKGSRDVLGDLRVALQPPQPV